MFGLPNPYVIGGVALVIAALFGWAIWERHDAIAAAKGEKAALELADLAQQDAKRWHDASDVRDGANAILITKLKTQDAAIEAEHFQREAADLAAAQSEADARNARAAFDKRVEELQAEAEKHPEQVVPLGALTAKRAQQLFD